MTKKGKDKFTDSGKTVFRISASQALAVAEMQIGKCRRLKEWHDAYAVREFPFFSRLDKEKPSYFEVKVSTPSNDDAGTVIISATDKNFPIIGFRTHGRSLSEEAISKSGHEVKRIIWHGLSAVTGEDEAGKEIISLGHKPTQVFDLKEYEEYRRKHKEKPLPKPLPVPKESEELQEEWKEVKKALGIVKSNPYGVIADSFIFARDWSRHADLKQYDLPNGNPVGCGATAWSALLAYHDMLCEPDLLYGTHDTMSDYIKRSMELFHDAIDTGDDGYNKAWNMNEGFSIYSDYHSFDGGPDSSFCQGEWDWDVCVLSSEPGSEIQNLICNLILLDSPVIVGLVTDTYFNGSQSDGHYCLGLATAKNNDGKLKYVLCDELYGKGLDDLGWWHRDTIFGAWGIYSVLQHTHPRLAVEENVWNEIDLANLGDEIYGVGRKCIEALPDPNPPVFLIQKGPATGFPIPEKGTNPKRFEFDESIEIPVYELQGSEGYPLPPSITAWNHKVTTRGYLKATKKFPADFRARDVAFTRESFANTLLQANIQDSQPVAALYTKTIDIPYLFLVWPDENGRIHIAYAIIPENLEDVSFTHVLLPERFRNREFCKISIAIAQADRTGPMLYIGYADDNDYFIDNNICSYPGRILIINIDLLFQIAESGEDLWPQDTVPNITLTQEIVGGPVGTEMPRNVVTDFKSHWVLFGNVVHDIRLSSNGSQVVLLWARSGWPNLLWQIHKSYTFRDLSENNVSYQDGIRRTYWGDCTLSIAYAKYGHRFLHHSRHIETDEDYWIGDFQARSCDIFYSSDSRILLVWNDPDGRLFIAYIRNEKLRRPVLLANCLRTGSNPKIAFVKDELDNRNIVVFSSDLFMDQKQIWSQFLYLSGHYVPGITDFDNLPK